jgi:hypothetical protein
MGRFFLFLIIADLIWEFPGSLSTGARSCRLCNSALHCYMTRGTLGLCHATLCNPTSLM